MAKAPWTWPTATGASAAAEGSTSGLSISGDPEAADPRSLQLRLDIARDLLAEGRIDAAESAWRAALAIEPGQPEALRGLAEVACRRGDDAAALAKVRVALSAMPGNLALRLRVAELHRRLGRLDLAGQALARLLADHPGHPDILLQSGHLARACGDRESAIAARGGDGDDRRSRRTAAKRAARRAASFYQTADAAYAAILDAAPKTTVALVGRAEVAHRRGDAAAALAHYRAALRRRPHDLRLRVRIGEQLLALGDLAAAEKHIALLSAGRRHDPDVLVLAGKLARALGDHAGALERFRAAERRRSGRASVAIETATELAALGRIAEAEAIFRAVATRDRGQLGAVLGIGDCQMARGDRAGALATYEAALSRHAFDRILRLRIVEALRLAGRIDDAVTRVAELAADFPADVDVLLQQGRIARARGDHDAALAFFRAAERRAPARPSPSVLVAGELRALGRIAAAKAALEAVLVRHPDHAGALLRLGELLLLAEDDEASALLVRARAADPARAEPWVHLATAASQQQSAQAALDLLDEAERVIGADPALALARVDHLLQRGRDNEADAALSNAEVRFPTDIGLRMRRIERDLELGRFAAVGAAIGRLPVATPQQRAVRLTLAGKLAETRWRFEEARSAFAAAVRDHPRYGAAHAGLARIDVAELKVADARRHLHVVHRLRQGSLVIQGRSRNPSQSLIGEILNEIWSNGPALDAARAALESFRVEALLAAIREEPAYTGGAIALLTLLRRTGRLALLPGPSGGARRIPRCLHQFWDRADVPGDVVELMRTWSDTNPTWRYRCFDLEAATRWLAAYSGPRVQRAFRTARQVAHKADLFRLAVLWREGGVYADADDRCMSALDDATAMAEMLLWQEPMGTVGNNFIAAAPRHPVIGAALRQAVAATLRGDAESIWVSTGPGVLTRALAHHLASDPARLDGLGRDIVVLERFELKRICTPGCKASYKSTVQHWAKQAFAKRR